ncbi:MAG TPA: hypothetical protein VFV39_06590, partial [Limnobacter sp.]|nr:hypothetical protein [Limnobacter sp.]
MKLNMNASQPGFRKARLVEAVEQAILLLALGGLVTISSEVSGRSSDTSAAFATSQVIRQFTLRNSVGQANQILQGRVAEVSGKLRGAGMGAPGAFFPASLGTVPSGFGVPQLDGNGRPLGYCAWDNNTDTDTASYRGGLSLGTQMVFAVVSPGLNGAFETSCDSIESTGGANGDDYVEIRLPAQVASQQYRSAVATVAALNSTPGQEGDVRLVLENNQLYSYVSGAWQPVASNGRFADDSATNGTDAISYTAGKVTVAEFQATVGTFSSNLSVGGTSTFTGAVTANNGITVAGGGLNVTGATSITGNTTINGATSIIGNTTITGALSATTLSGNGGGLTDLNANNINAGMLGPAFGGTGVNAGAAANGALLIGNGSGFALSTLTAGAGISIMNGPGAIMITNNGVTQFNGRTGSVMLTLEDVNNVVTYNTRNVRVGTGAIASNSTANGLTALGYNALNVNTTGQDNTAVGTFALQSLTTGGGNTAVGHNAAASLVSGSLVTAVGEGAAGWATGSESVALGHRALFQFQGAYNTGVGNYAFGSLVSGAANTALGHFAMPSLTSGNANIAIGHRSGNLLNTGSGNIFIGEFAAGGLTSGDSNIALGNNSSVANGLSNAVVIGDSASVTTSNTVVLGRTIDNTVIGATADDASGNKLQVTGRIGLTGDLELGKNLNPATQRGSAIFFNTAGDTNWGIYRSTAGAGKSLGGGWAPNALDGSATAQLRFRASGNTGEGFLFENEYETALFSINGATGNVIALGSVTASAFSGSGALLTGLNASNISAGTLAVARGGTGVDASAAANGALLIGNGSGFALGTITGTANQINVSNGAGSITLSLPQNIATTSTPTFGGLALNGGLTGTTANFSGAVTAQRLIVGDMTGGVSRANVAIGLEAFLGTPSGMGGNTAVGYRTLRDNTTGYNNVAMGYSAMLSNTTGYNNVAVGADALRSNTTGSYNIAIGQEALEANTTGINNIALGADALQLLTTGNNNIAIGYEALESATTSYDNLAIGTSAMRFTTTGFGNVALGNESSEALTTGYENVSVGVDSLKSTTTGFRNVAVGKNALEDNITGDGNTALGFNTLSIITGGTENLAV